MFCVIFDVWGNLAEADWGAQAPKIVKMKICSDDCVRGGQPVEKIRSNTKTNLGERRSKSWNSMFRRVSEENLRKIPMILVFFLWKMSILRSKIADFGVILSDFLVNYDVSRDFQGVRESARRAPRRSGIQNVQND